MEPAGAERHRRVGRRPSQVGTGESNALQYSSVLRAVKKGQAETRPGLLGEMAHNKVEHRIYFDEVFPIGGATTSLCCAQAPSPNAVAITATIMMIFKNFNPSRLLSSQVAPVCLGREPRGSNAFLQFFEPSKTDRSVISSNRLFLRLW